VEAFVHIACIGVGGLDQAEDLLDFGGIVRGQALHRERDMPDVARRRVGAADARSDFACVEEGIFRAEQQLAG
jgi:hypothetical protein